MSLSVSLHSHCLLAIYKYKAAIWLSQGPTKAGCAGGMCYFENKLHLIIARAKTKSVPNVGLQKHLYGHVQQYVQQSHADTSKEEHRETKGGIFNGNVLSVLTIFILTLHLRVVVCKMPNLFSLHYTSKGI